MTVNIYVEGGGDSKELHIRCRQGFRKLLEKAGFIGRMPGIVACGGRGTAFDRFETAVEVSNTTDYPILLVDSEEPVSKGVNSWEHLNSRDGWKRPDRADDDQAQLMVTCMETWIIADRAALSDFFGDCLQTSALLPETGLEQYDRHRVQDTLENATRPCGSRRAYRKGRRSFQVLERLNPDTLRQYLPHFKHLIETLEKHLRRTRDYYRR
ncbi:MAG: DUF4276 family protein [Chloroflexi bacterium]|nr:DUF4276 family protein [Chloroflexota bacterium]MBU1660984.1 DUF4276 family protein [Chloroflexota bacterium]